MNRYRDGVYINVSIIPKTTPKMNDASLGSLSHDELQESKACGYDITFDLGALFTGWDLTIVETWVDRGVS